MKLGDFSREGLFSMIWSGRHLDGSAEQIQRLGDVVGRERILVFHGTRDNMINFIHGEMLLKDFGGEESGVTKVFREGIGHVGPLEIRREFNAVFGDAVGAGIGDGSFAPVDEGRVVRALLSLGIDVVRWYGRDGPDSPEQLGHFYAGLALNMVAAPVGPPRTGG